MKKIYRIPWLPLGCLLVMVSCSFENKADIEAIRAEKSTDFTSPLENVDVAFRPAAIKACCYVPDNPPSVMIDGNTGGTHWDWCWWDNQGRTDYEELGDLTNMTSSASSNGHSAYFTSDTFTNAGGYNNNRACHFYTVDLGGVKTNIYAVEFYPRNNAGMIAEYEVWVSDNPIGVDPQTPQGAYLAAKGSWTYVANTWFTADFTQPKATYTTNGGNGGLVEHARYIQVRSYQDGNGTGDFEICGMETRAVIFGDFDGTIDNAVLTDAYVKGVRAYQQTRSPKIAFRLGRLLYGEYDEDDPKELVTPGAIQLLEKSRDSAAIAGMTIFEKVSLQQQMDDITRPLLQFLGSLDF